MDGRTRPIPVRGIAALILSSAFVCVDLPAGSELGGQAAGCHIESGAVRSISWPGHEIELGRADLVRIAVGSDGTTWIAPFSEIGALVGFDAEGEEFGPWYIPQISGSDRDLILSLSALGEGQVSVFSSRWHVVMDRSGHQIKAEELELPGLVRSQVPISDSVLLVDAPQEPYDPAASRLFRFYREGGWEPVGIVGLPQLRVGEMSTGVSVRITFAAGNDGRSIWAGASNAYRVLQVPLDGGPPRLVEPEANWFQEWTVWVPPYDGTPPPRLWDLYQSGDGLLWTMTYVPSEEFEVMELPEPGRVEHEPIGPIHPQYDTLIETLDPESGALLSQCRYPTLLGGFSSGPTIIAPEPPHQGSQRFVVYRLDLNTDDLRWAASHAAADSGQEPQADRGRVARSSVGQAYGSNVSSVPCPSGSWLRRVLEQGSAPCTFARRTPVSRRRGARMRWSLRCRIGSTGHSRKAFLIPQYTRESSL